MAFMTPSPLSVAAPLRSLSAQALSPTSDYMTRSTMSTFNSENPSAILLQRWHSLSAQIAQSRLPSKVVIALNRVLDQAEHTMKDCPRLLKPVENPQVIGLGIRKVEERQQHVEDITEITPPQSVVGSPTSQHSLPQPTASTSEEDQKVIERLTDATARLARRQERFKYFHHALISEIQEKASQVEHLQADVMQLEKDAADDTTELMYLRFNLRMLEIQALPYVPRCERDTLTEKVERWKLEWVGCDRRSRKRRRRRETDWQKSAIASNSGVSSET